MVGKGIHVCADADRVFIFFVSCSVPVGEQ